MLNLGHPTGGCMLCWCLSQVMWPRGHGAMDRASACGGCSPRFESCDIKMFFLLLGKGGRKEMEAVRIKLHEP